MDKKIEEKIVSYYNQRKSKCLALRNWLERKNKSFSLKDALICIFKTANNSFTAADDIVDKIIQKQKTQGRSQIGNTLEKFGVDIRPNENGELEIYGLNAFNPAPLVGQHRQDTGGFRKDGQKSKIRIAKEREYKDIEQAALELFPNEHPQYIKLAMQAIKDYKVRKQKSLKYVVNRLKSGKAKLDDDIWVINDVDVVKESKQRKTIIITESMAEKLKKELKMTEYKFNSNIKKFISKLLQDPVNTEVPFIFKTNKIKRSELLRQLENSKLIVRSERISDKDENGQPKKATMMVKFKCPKKDFDRKLKKLYIKMFEKNVPKKINEDGATGCCGDGNGNTNSGAFVTKIGDNKNNGIIRRHMPTEEVEESATTFGTGNYTYDAPCGIGDKKTLKRHDGENGSVSINHV